MFGKKNQNTALTEEEKLRKEKVRTRLFFVLVAFDVFCVAYLAFEMISIFILKKG